MRHAQKALLLGLALALVGAGAFAQVDFSRYVALGDSLTAGVSSNGSVLTIQNTSYPALIARQAGVSGFQQPLVTEPGLPPLLYLAALNVTPFGVSPSIQVKSGLGSPTNATLPTPYNNLGVDGFDLKDVLTRTGIITNFPADLAAYAQGKTGKNVPFADLVLRFPVFPGTTTPATALAQAIALQPTFLTVWAGSNDILGAAQTAVVLDGVTMTTTADFRTRYTQILGALRQARPNTPILVATIQDVLAFLTAVKPYLVNPSSGAHIPLIGEAGPLTEQDFLTLYASSLIAQGIGIPKAAGGTGLPLPEGSFDPATGTLTAGVILRAGEMQSLVQQVAAYNQIIKEVAGSSSIGAKVFDLNAVYRDWNANGVTLGGVKLTTAYLTGGIFSYDGVHPQAIGYALLAREWIKAINANFGTTLPDIDMRPFLEGTSVATTVLAANTVVSEQAAITMVKGYAPNAVTDKLQAHSRLVRRHIADQGKPGPLDPGMP
ncbi:MAG TPA: SGNH/GDSL hydrolase family protein [Thermoanaerobaculaceae bacterium]|nr:SGNH/GDSL hydrolase family protein [Thermoanaerobaculaceae bacterium]